MLSEKIVAQLRALEKQARQNFQEDEIQRCLHFMADLQSDGYRVASDEKSDQWYPNMRVRGVNARPVFQVSEFGNVADLKKVGRQISAEIRAVNEKIETNLKGDFAELSIGGTWENFTIKSGSAWNETAKQILPVTCEWLSTFPRLGELSFISKLPSRTTIEPHCGPWNIRANLHLGITIPDQCGISVAGHTLEWKEASWLAFDDSFEHHVWNNSSSTRIVLVVNAWHPDLSQAEVSVFSAISDILVKSE